MLCEIVATHLLAELAARADLPPALAEELRRRVAARVAPSAPEPAAPIDTTAEAALAQAHAAGSAR